MQKYEYKCAMVLGGAEKTTSTLNEYGQDGWELVCVYNAWFYFKRPIE